ncbi:DUF4440 domain-containing protein [Acinetobacter sp. YH12073]|uniref:YybH family protein n=1 Tax=Acinetobacter sp. YH12073 TaxID=2601069 RepID=UPI0015D1996B|nr:nuclear transport factor 2 family protein [Acinetobacter sp. YH12073]
MSLHTESVNYYSASEVVKRYGQYLNEQDIDKILGLYHVNAEIIPDQLASVQGAGNIISFYKNTFASIKILGELAIHSVYESEDVAIVRCEEVGEVTDLSSGVKSDHYFREMFVLLKVDVEWKIYKYMFSINDSQIDS